jgi:hypothetical protein
MRKFFAAVVVAGISVLAGAGLAHAEGNQTKGTWYLGFWDYNAPVGVRTLVSDDLEVMGALGMRKPDEGDTEIDIAGAVGFRLIHGKSTHLTVRPGFFYATNPGGGADSYISLRGDLVFEWEITDGVSFVTGPGIEFQTISPEGDGDSISIFNTRSLNGALVGFWVRLPS